MKRVLKWLLIAILLTLSSSFLYGKETKADWLCKPGQYAKYNGSTFDCTGTKNGNRDTQVKKINTYIRYTAVTVAGLSSGFAVMMIVYAGFMYTTSAGEAKQIQKAKVTIMQAGIGMFISLLSFVILGIISSAAGVPLL